MDLLKKLSAIAALAIACPAAEFGYFSKHDAGQEVFSFLSTFDSPRNAALEKSASALPSTDPTVVQLNPAAVYIAEGKQRVAEAHWQTGEFADNQGTLSFTTQYKKFVLQFSYNWISYGTITGYDVYGEENGSEYGIIYLLEHFNLFKKEDLILIPDGGDKIGETIEIAEKNIMWMKVHVVGKQTHGSRPDTGANACLAACDMSLRLHILEKKFDKRDSLFEPDYSTFQPTKREKNVDSINIIPGEDTFCMDCRILPCYKLADVLKEVDKCCREVEAQYGVKIEYTTPQKSESPATPTSAPVAQKLAAAIKKVHGIEAEFIGIGGGTVGAELRREGIDAVVWSTLDDQAHQPNEYCVIENLIKDAETLIEFFA
jgi:di/tripeptidase